MLIGKPCLECPCDKACRRPISSKLRYRANSRGRSVDRIAKAKGLIETGKTTESIVFTVPLDALVELVGWDVIDQLRENDAAEMHASACPILQHRPSTGENAQKRRRKVKPKKAKTFFISLSRQGLRHRQNTIAGIRSRSHPSRAFVVENIIREL